ncbi:MAG TPA: DUF3379 family protein [Xanthomonadaceae bacterium]|nr:DUF3379 family protein [Xanthomonadaceae bacterium]
MNCLDYRRRLGSEPREDELMRAHRVECPRCAEHHRRSQDFEQALRAAMQVPVPEDLAEMVLLRQTTVRRRRLPHVPGWLALAASIVLAAGLVFVLWPMASPTDEDELAQLAMDHYLHEPYALDPRPPVPAPLLRGSAARLGVDLAAAPEAVSYAAVCPMGQYRSLHLVVQRPEAPVTLFYVPALDTPERRFEQDGIHGRALTVPGGTLLVMAARDDLLDAVARSWAVALSPPAEVAAGQR